MTYIMDILPSCQRTVGKSCKKNPLLKKVLHQKMNEILINPFRYKPLKHNLAGERRVHIMKSFVLKFEIDCDKKIVTFISFTHHDKAY